MSSRVGHIEDSEEPSLAAFIRMKGRARATCRILVSGQRVGVLFLDAGQVTHATYAGIGGEEAAYAILGEAALDYRITSHVAPPVPNMRLACESFSLEGMRRLDERNRRPLPTPPRVPVPSPAPPPRTRTLQDPATAATGRALRPPPPPVPSPVPSHAPPPLAQPLQGPATAATGRALPFSPRVIMAGGMVILLGVGLLAFTRDVRVTVQSGPAEAVAVEPLARERDPADDAVEASALADTGGSLPVLVAGAPPQSPDPGMALKPTVVCRLLVDRQGGVARAKVFQHRPDFARFEDVALSAVKQYRFQPARRSGQAVSVWINWSVDFI